MSARLNADIFSQHQRESADHALAAAREQWTVAIALEDLSRRISETVRGQLGAASPSAHDASTSHPDEGDLTSDADDTLLMLLGERQVLVERFVRLGERCMGQGMGTDDPTLLSGGSFHRSGSFQGPLGATADQIHQLAEHAQRIDAVVRRLMDSDAHDMRLLAERRDALAREMARLDSGRNVSTAYVAADAAGASFADRHG